MNGYSFWKTLLKCTKNLELIGAIAAVVAMHGGAAEVFSELGDFGFLIAIGLQFGFSWLLDWLKHKEPQRK